MGSLFYSSILKQKPQPVASPPEEATVPLDNEQTTEQPDESVPDATLPENNGLSPIENLPPDNTGNNTENTQEQTPNLPPNQPAPEGTQNNQVNISI